MDNLEQIVSEARSAFAATSDPDALEQVKARFLGKSGQWRMVESAWGVQMEEGQAERVLDALGRRLGCLVAGGLVDPEAAARKFVESFSAGKLGRITLEVPENPLMEDELP